MLKNKIIVKKIRNIVILIMAMVIMIGAYKNIDRSRAEDVKELQAISLDNYGYLAMERFALEAKQIEDDLYEIELPDSINSKKINQIVKVTLEEYVPEEVLSENADKENAKTENTAVENTGTDNTVTGSEVVETPAEGENAVPENTTTETPTETLIQTENTTPESTQVETPAEGVTVPENTPTQPESTTPENAPVETPAQPENTTPENTPTETPAQPESTTPENAPVETPTQPESTTPENTTVETPAQPENTTPENTETKTEDTTPENVAQENGTPLEIVDNKIYLTREQIEEKQINIEVVYDIAILEEKEEGGYNKTLLLEKSEEERKQLEEAGIIGPVVENEKTKVLYSKILRHEDEENKKMVELKGYLPKDAELQVEEVSKEQLKELFGEKEIDVAYDIKIVIKNITTVPVDEANPNSELQEIVETIEINPEDYGETCEVTIKDIEIEQNSQVYHVKEDNTLEQVNIKDNSTEGNVSFEAESFSVYLVTADELVNVRASTISFRYWYYEGETLKEFTAYGENVTIPMPASGKVWLTVSGGAGSLLTGINWPDGTYNSWYESSGNTKEIISPCSYNFIPYENGEHYEALSVWFTVTKANLLDLRLNNSEGEAYENATFTKHNVYVGINQDSGYTSTKYTITKENGETYLSDQTGANTLTEEGVYTIVASAVDSEGNEITDSYTVKIDKTEPITTLVSSEPPLTEVSNYGPGIIYTNQTKIKLSYRISDETSGLAEVGTGGILENCDLHQDYSFHGSFGSRGGNLVYNSQTGLYEGDFDLNTVQCFKVNADGASPAHTSAVEYGYYTVRIME